MNDEDSIQRETDESIQTVEIHANSHLVREIRHRTAGCPLMTSRESSDRDIATVIGADLARYYALVEQAGQDEVRDLFSLDELGALVHACWDRKLTVMDPRHMSQELLSVLEDQGQLSYWQVSQLDILNRFEKLSILARCFLLNRLDEQVRLTKHRPTRQTIDLVAEDMGAKSRDWGPDGWGLDAPRFYSVIVTIPEFHGCRNVEMTIVRYRRSRPVLPYIALIGEKYVGLDECERSDLEDAVDELFTRKEANCVKDMIERAYKTPATLWERDLRGNVGNYARSMLPVGGGVGMTLMGAKQDPELPFLAAGCYDLRFHEVVSESDDANTEAQMPDEDAID